MEINDSSNTNYRQALAELRTGNNWTIAEYVAANNLPLNGVITGFTDEATGKVTRRLILGNKRFQISSTIPNEELVDDKGNLNASTYKFHVVELVNKYQTVDPKNPVLCYQIHRTPIGKILMDVNIIGLDDTLEQE